MKDMLLRVWRDDEGQDLAEYAILLGVILLVTVAAVGLIGTDVNAIFGKADEQLQKVGQ